MRLSDAHATLFRGGTHEQQHRAARNRICPRRHHSRGRRQGACPHQVEEFGGPYLVICPVSVKRNWAREIETVRLGTAVGIPGGGAAGDDAASFLQREGAISNYDILKKHEQALSGPAADRAARGEDG